MIMSSEEEIKKRLMQQRMQQGDEQGQQKHMEEALKNAMSRILDEKARERMNNLRLVKPDVAGQLEMYLAQLFQSGQLKEKITDEQLVVILRKLTEKRETKIKRK